MDTSILTLENINYAIGDKVILKSISGTINDTDRIGVLGINGAGKSTLLSVIAGTLEADSGSITARRGLKISYLSQNPIFDNAISILDNVVSIIHGQDSHWDTVGEAKSVLAKFGITDTSITPNKLSGGQKKRAALAAAMLTPCDLLILDEPTNDLDIQTLQVLEDYLDSFNGIIITVSHDRYFLDRVVTRIFSFEPDGKLMQSEGAYTEYLEHKLERDGALNPSSIIPASYPAAGNGASDYKDYKASRKLQKLTYKEQQEYDTIESLIDQLTAKSKQCEEEMLKVSNDFVKLQAISEEKSAIDAELDTKIERYLELQEKFESLQK